MAYAIGVAEPVSIFVDTFGTGRISDDEISELVRKNFDLRPAAIIANFDLRNLPAKMAESSIRNWLHMVMSEELILMFLGNSLIR